MMAASSKAAAAKPAAPIGATEEISREKINLTQEVFARLAKDYAAIAVAFSGGVDSALVLALAIAASEAERAASGRRVPVYAATARTKLHPSGEWQAAAQAATALGASFLLADIDELGEAGIADNPPDRCYRCKKAIFSRLKDDVREKIAAEFTASGGENAVSETASREENVPPRDFSAAEHKVILLDGTNYDDLGAYRPGLKALEELGVFSPLAAAKLTKSEVRALAARYNLATAAKPAAPCLATRLPYGTPLSYELLAKIDRAENFIRSLGFYNVRVRVHGEIARLEVDADNLDRIIADKEAIIAALKREGFRYITLDIEGFRSGSMDKN